MTLQRFLLPTLAVAGLLLATPVRAADPALPALNLDASQTTVSGISSGAFMAVQMAVVHSAGVAGVAATAERPPISAPAMPPGPGPG